MDERLGRLIPVTARKCTFEGSANDTSRFRVELSASASRTDLLIVAPGRVKPKIGA
jgi:hypothetical protein